MNVTSIEIIAAVLFGLAVVHTFSTRYFVHLAHRRREHSGLWHLLGEVETVFGLWALVLLLVLGLGRGWPTVSDYMASRHFTEPAFVFVIMVIAASRPIFQLASGLVSATARALPMRPGIAGYFLSISLVPLLGSLITEPAAMTLAALMLRDRIFSRPISTRLKYATLGVLFVNVSIGGTLTNFAAPPVLMAAARWDWTSGYMLAHFGWKAAIAVLLNAAVLTFAFRRQIVRCARVIGPDIQRRVPPAFAAIHVGLLAGVVLAGNRPEIFMGLFMLFLGLAEAYSRYHARLMLREGLMVAFFLAGLVVLGGPQTWWLQPLLSRLDESVLFFGAAALTAVVDNAALTYLGSLVEGLTDGFRYALVAGAVAGGGLTVIANAPNPAGFAILKGSFDEKSINPFWLLGAALPPTLVALAAFRLPTEGLRQIFDPRPWRWLADLDPGMIFLFLLPFVVAAFGLLAELLRRQREDSAAGEVGPAEPAEDDRRSA